MGGAGKRKAERDLERERLVDEAFTLLLTAPLEVLTEAVRPGRGKGSADARRATKLFGASNQQHPAGSDPGWTPAEDMLVRVAQLTRQRGLDRAGDALRETVAVYLDGGDPLDKWGHALSANVASAFDNRAFAVSRLLWVASMTGTSRWSDDQRQTGRGALLSEKISNELRCLERAVDDQWLGAFEQAMTDVGLRPAAGFEPSTIVKLVKCFMSGAILEMFIDNSITSEMVGQAMVRFAMSFGEPGALGDPRYLRQYDIEYTRMLDGARCCYEGAPTGTVVGVAELASQLAVDQQAAEKLFPTDADLADSTLRSLIVTTRRAGSGDVAPALLVGVIERIETLRVSFPALFHDRPTRLRPVREETVELVEDLLERCRHANIETPDITGAELVAAAWGPDRAVNLSTVKGALIRATPRPELT